MKTIHVLFLISGLMCASAQQKKNTAAVLNLTNSGRINKIEIEKRTSEFRDYLVNAGVYIILKREKMDSILKAKNFSGADTCSTTECAIKIGQLLGVDRMITGTIGLLDGMWTLEARIIDVSTGQILKIQSEIYEGKRDGLFIVVEKLAYALSGRMYPYKTETKTTTDKPSAGTQKITAENSFTDPRDGKTYKTVKIGNQVWMAENLNYETYRGSWYYNRDSSNGGYGRLYTWSTAMTAAPPGWHLPTDKEWTTLTSYLGGENTAGNKLKEAGTGHWASPNKGATNQSGFTALPGGFRDDYDTFRIIGDYGGWWSATEDLGSYAWDRSLYEDRSGVYRNDSNKLFGYSVRCVRD